MIVHGRSFRAPKKRWILEEAMPDNSNAMKLFISYSSEDQQIADVLKLTLKDLRAMRPRQHKTHLG
jgi:hypothetical protein